MVVSQPTYVVHQPSAAAHLGFNTTFVQCPGCHNQVRNHVVHSQALRLKVIYNATGVFFYTAQDQFMESDFLDSWNFLFRHLSRFEIQILNYDF